MSNITSNSNLYRVPDHTALTKRFIPLYVEVIFGAPGKMCHGAGICKILPVEHVRVHWKCPSARAWLCVSPNDTISLSFDRNTLSPVFYEQYFKGQVFQVEEAYAISKGLLSMLNMNSFTVEPGKYSVEVSERFIVVCF